MSLFKSFLFFLPFVFGINLYTLYFGSLATLHTWLIQLDMKVCVWDSMEEKVEGLPEQVVFFPEGKGRHIPLQLYKYAIVQVDFVFFLWQCLHV